MVSKCLFKKHKFDLHSITLMQTNESANANQGIDSNGVVSVMVYVMYFLH